MKKIFISNSHHEHERLAVALHHENCLASMLKSIDEIGVKNPVSM